MKEFEIAGEAHKILNLMRSKGIRERHEEWLIPVPNNPDLPEASIVDKVKIKDKLVELITPFMRDPGFTVDAWGNLTHDTHKIGPVNRWMLVLETEWKGDSIRVTLDRPKQEGISVEKLIEDLKDASSMLEGALKKYAAAMTDDIEPYLQEKVEEITLRYKYSLGDARNEAGIEAEQLNDFLDSLNYMALVDNVEEVLEHSSWEDHYNGGYLQDLAGPRFSDFYEIATG